MKAAKLMVCLAAAALGIQAQGPGNTPRPRLLCVFLDLNSIDAASNRSGNWDNIIQFVQQQVAPSDLVQIVTYGSRMNVIQDFTGDQDSVLAALRTALPNQTGVAEPGNNDPNARVQALQSAVSSLVRFSERKALVYVSTGAPKLGDDEDHSPLKNAFDAALRSNVTIYPVDVRGLLTPAQR